MWHVGLLQGLSDVSTSCTFSDATGRYFLEKQERGPGQFSLKPYHNIHYPARRAPCSPVSAGTAAAADASPRSLHSTSSQQRSTGGHPTMTGSDTHVPTQRCTPATALPGGLESSTAGPLHQYRAQQLQQQLQSQQLQQQLRDTSTAAAVAVPTRSTAVAGQRSLNQICRTESDVAQHDSSKAPVRERGPHLSRDSDSGGRVHASTSANYGSTPVVVVLNSQYESAACLPEGGNPTFPRRHKVRLAELISVV